MIKTNKSSNVLLAIILGLFIINAAFGKIIFHYGYNIIFPNEAVYISLFHMLISSIDNIVNNSTGIILAVFFTYCKSEPKENKLFWATAGFLFGLPSLILYIIKKVIDNIEDKANIQKSIKTVLIIIICILPIEFVYNNGIKTLMVTILGAQQYGHTAQLDYAIKTMSVLLIIVFNIWLCVKVHCHVKEKGQNSAAWWISTIFLGIIPIALFNLIELINIKKQVTPPSI